MKRRLISVFLIIVAVALMAALSVANYRLAYNRAKAVEEATLVVIDSLGQQCPQDVYTSIAQAGN